jgi:microcystin-dependent protein
MSSPFVAEIRMWACNFAPTGWAQCNGQLLPISQNTALFSLLGTFYGGDGKSTFALPNLEGSAPMGQGAGAGLSQRFLGEQSGVPFVTLLDSEMPGHNHSMNGANLHFGLNPTPAPDQAISKSQGGAAFTSATANLSAMNFQALAIAGGSLPHNNMQPYLCVLFCIAMQGVFPPRG